MEGSQKAPDTVFDDQKNGPARQESENENSLEGSDSLVVNETLQQTQEESDEDIFADMERMADDNPIDDESHEFSQNSNSDDEVQASQAMSFIDEVTESQPRHEYSQLSQTADLTQELSASGRDLSYDDQENIGLAGIPEAHQPHQNHGTPNHLYGNSGVVLNGHHSSSSGQGLDQHNQEQPDLNNTVKTCEDDGQVKVETLSPTRARDFGNTTTRQAPLSPSPSVKEEPMSPLSRNKPLGQIDGERESMTSFPTPEKSSQQSRDFPESENIKEENEDKVKNQFGDELMENSKVGTKEGDEEQFYDANEDSPVNASKNGQVTSRVQEGNTQEVEPSSRQVLDSELLANQQLPEIFQGLANGMEPSDDTPSSLFNNRLSPAVHGKDVLIRNHSESIHETEPVAGEHSHEIILAQENSQQIVHPTVTDTADNLNLLTSFAPEAITTDDTTVNVLLEESELGTYFAQSAQEGKADQTEPGLMSSEDAQVVGNEQKEIFLESDSGFERTLEGHFPNSSTKVGAEFDGGESTTSPRSYGVETFMEATFQSTPLPSGKKPKSKEGLSGNLELSSKRVTATTSLETFAISGNATQAERESSLVTESSLALEIGQGYDNGDQMERRTTSKTPSASATSAPTSPIIVSPDDEKLAEMEDQKSSFETVGKYTNKRSKTIKSKTELTDSDTQDNSLQISGSQKKVVEKTQSKGRGRQKKTQVVNTENDLTILKSDASQKQPASKKATGNRVPAANKSIKVKKEIKTVDLDSDNETPDPDQEPPKGKVAKRDAGNLDLEVTHQNPAKRQKHDSHENGDIEYEDRISAIKDQEILRGVDTRGVHRSHSSPEVVIHSKKLVQGSSIDLTIDEDDSSLARDQQSGVAKVAPKTKTKPAATRKRPNQSAADTKPSAKKAKVEPTKATRGKNSTPSLHDDDDVHITSIQPIETEVLRPIAKSIGEFPRFNEGDVYISLSAKDPSQSYILHSETLSHISNFFKCQLESGVSEPTPVLRKTVKHLRARFALRILPKTGKVRLKRGPFTMTQSEIATLALKNAEFQHRRLGEIVKYEGAGDSSTRTASTSGSRSQYEAQDQIEDSKNDMAKIVAEVQDNMKERFCNSLDNLFRAYYKLPLKLDKENIEAAFEQVEGLLDLAEEYESSNFQSIRSELKEHMTDFFQLDLYRAIAQNPPRWLRLSLKLHSPPIFKESVMHVVGNYPKWQEVAVEAIGNYPDTILYIANKINSFKRIKNDIDQHLLRENHFGVGETKYAEMKEPTIFDVKEPDYNTYLVNVAWKDWYGLSLQVADGARSRNHEDASMYRDISGGGSSFMDSDFICGRLEKIRNCQFSEEEVEDIRLTLATIKNHAQEKVQPLCKNWSMLKPEEEGITHFTCVKVTNEELPWSN